MEKDRCDAQACQYDGYGAESTGMVSEDKALRMRRACQIMRRLIRCREHKYVIKGEGHEGGKNGNVSA